MPARRAVAGSLGHVLHDLEIAGSANGGADLCYLCRMDAQVGRTQNRQSGIGSPKERFRDAHERRSYAKAMLIAARLMEDPDMANDGQAYLDRFVRPDQRQSGSYALWTRTLRLPVEEIARRLLADTPEGELLRDTAPVFSVIQPSELRAALEQLP